MRAIRQAATFGALTALALFGTVACEGSGEEITITEADFLSQFEVIYCDAHESCTPDELCPAMSEVLSTSCTYDAGFAQDCLAGDYSCDDSGGEGAEQLIVPTTCASVYDCEGGGDDDDDDDDPTGSYPTPTGSGEPTL